MSQVQNLCFRDATITHITQIARCSIEPMLKVSGCGIHSHNLVYAQTLLHVNLLWQLVDPPT